MKDDQDIQHRTHVPQDLIKLGTYEWPLSEVRQTLGHLLEKVKVGLSKDPNKEAIDTDDLKSLSNGQFGGAVRTELALILQEQLDRTYLEWNNTKGTAKISRAFVHPPMAENPLESWAKRHDLPVLKTGEHFYNFVDAPCVVVTNLEHYFSRDHTQLAGLFAFFKNLSTFEGKVIAGCNSWAWRFLKQFDDAHLIFDDVKTTPAFDADALSSLLGAALAKIGKTDDILSVASGDAIFARNNKDSLKDPYLESLAGLSLGLPWVAAEMFLGGISQGKADKADLPHEGLWVSLPKASSLTTSDSDALLFALHALMIHGSRSVEDLSNLLPHRVPNGLWSELERKGLVEFHNDKVHLTLRNYPDIRSELGAAGFNLDEL